MNQLVIAPLLLPLLTGTLLLLLRDTVSFRIQRQLNLTAVVAQILFAVILLVSDHEILVYALGNWPAPSGIVLVADRLAVWMLLITAILALFALLSAMRGSDQDGRHFHLLFQLQMFGLNGAFLTGDLFNLFVFFEILLLASYGLLLHGGGARRTRAGLHVVALNLLGSTLFLFAAGLIYGTLGTLNMADLSVKIAATPPENLGLARTAGLLLFGVFALKAALMPLHLWLPSAYSAAAAPVAALFAIMTKVGAYCLLRIGTLIFGEDAGAMANLYANWLLPLALATLIIGAFGVLSASELRHQAAYLVVVSVGLLLAAFGLGTPDAISAGLYYLAHATFATAALFLLSETIASRRGASLDRLVSGVLIPRSGLIGRLFFITAMLVAGLPPFSGFLGKFLVLRAAFVNPLWPWVMGIVLISGLLTLIALTRSGSLLFWRTEGISDAAAAGIGELTPVIGLLTLCLAMTIWAAPILALTKAAANQLLRPQAYVQAVLGATVEAENR